MYSILVILIDLRSSNKEDPESVKEARTLEIKYIRKWIDEYML